MTGDKKPELALRGQPSLILARLRPAFKAHVRPHTENRRGERLGGGSILNAQGNHRLSRDVLGGVPKGLKPIQEDPVGYANDAILESRYERLALRIVDGRAEIEGRLQGCRDLPAGSARGPTLRRQVLLEARAKEALLVGRLYVRAGELPDELGEVLAADGAEQRLASA